MWKDTLIYLLRLRDCYYLCLNLHYPRGRREDSDCGVWVKAQAADDIASLALSSPDPEFFGFGVGQHER